MSGESRRLPAGRVEVNPIMLDRSSRPHPFPLHLLRPIQCNRQELLVFQNDSSGLAVIPAGTALGTASCSLKTHCVRERGGVRCVRDCARLLRCGRASCKTSACCHLLPRTRFQKTNRFAHTGEDWQHSGAARACALCVLRNGGWAERGEGAW